MHVWIAKVFLHHYLIPLPIYISAVIQKFGVPAGFCQVPKDIVVAKRILTTMIGGEILNIGSSKWEADQNRLPNADFASPATQFMLPTAANVRI
jgi:hypothetical protein